MMFFYITLLLIALINAVNNVAVGYKDERSTGQGEKECYQPSNVSHEIFSLNDYKRLRDVYTGCIYVNGNLKIAMYSSNKMFDFTFLRTIRYVRGYVWIFGYISVKVIHLDNLEVIRANKTSNNLGTNCSLSILCTGYYETGIFKELHMPRLKEISNGNVCFYNNPSLQYIETIDWTSIVKLREESLHFEYMPYFQTFPIKNVTSICPNGRTWGSDSSLCQQDLPFICHTTCNERYFGPGESECCHGSSDEQCHTCKDFKYLTRCVGFCPDTTYPHLQNCVLR